MGRALFLILCCNAIIKQISSCDDAYKNQGEGTPCALLDVLRSEQWDAEDQPCLDATLEMLQGVKNSTLWATWIWDAMQRPSGVLYGSRYQLGNFDQCIKPPWLDSHPHLRTQYCLADIHLTDINPKKRKSIADPNGPVEPYLNTASRFGRRLNFMRWSVCFSTKCSIKAMTRLLQSMQRTQHLAQTASQIKLHSCQHSEYTNEYGFGFKAFMCMLLFLFAAVLSSTYFIDNLNSDTLSNRLAKSFYLKRNWEALMRVNKEDIQVLNGMRFTSAVLVVLVHYICYNIYNFTISGLDIDRVSSTKPLNILLHSDVVIDTFFVMSGLLLVRSIVTHQRLGKRSLFRLLWSRYVRLIGTQAFMVFYFACVFSHAGSGPLWPYLSKDEVEDCSNNWWANLLMINNYVKTSNMCHMVSWNNSCDYQLSILGTFLYYTYQKRKHVGLRLFTIAFVVSLISPGLVTYWEKLPAIMIFDVEHSGNLKSNPVFLGSYIQSHHRAGAYLLGMILGHIMTVYKLSDYRKSIPTKYAVLGALASLFVMEKVLVIGAMMVVNDYNPLQIAVFVSVNRIIWAFAICCLIVCCEYGTVPIVGDYLQLKFAVPMGRLSYGVYMIHMAFVYRIVYSTRSLMTHEFLTVNIAGLGVVCISYIVSLILWHMVEAPLINISNILLDAISEKKKMKTDDEKTAQEVFKVEDTTILKELERISEDFRDKYTNNVPNNGLNSYDSEFIVHVKQN